MKKLLIGLLLLAMVVFAAAQTVQPASEKEKPNAETSAVNSVGELSSGLYTVVVENGKFMPVDLEVNAGDTVEWVNLDNHDHSITLDHCEVETLLPVGSTFRYTFTEEGEFHYLSLLGEAQGTVTVR